MSKPSKFPKSTSVKGRTRKKAARRSPRQSRSRELVKAVRDAGRLILAESGPESLTTNAIAERAGVSVGSLYQYFENKEAILEAIYDQEDENARENVPDFISSLQEMPPRQRLRLGVEYAVERHRRMLDLDADYYREHHTRYRISATLAEESAAIGGRAVGMTRKFMERDETAEKAGLHLDHAAFLMGRGISAILRAAIEESPDLLNDPSFVDEIVLMMSRYLFPDSPDEDDC